MSQENEFLNGYSIQYNNTFSNNIIHIDKPYEFQISINSDTDLSKISLEFTKGTISEIQVYNGNTWETSTGIFINPNKISVFNIRCTFILSCSITLKVNIETKNNNNILYTEINNVVETLPIMSSNSFVSPFNINKEYEFIIDIDAKDYENRLGNIKYDFSNNEFIKKIELFDDEKNEYIKTNINDLFLDNITIIKSKQIKFKIVFALVGTYSFQILLNDIVIFYTKYNVDYDYDIQPVDYIDVEQCKIPDGANIEINNTDINFIYQSDISNEFWSSYYKPYGKDSDPLHAYAEVKFIAPQGSTHWRITTSKYDSGITELTNSDFNSVAWYFPVASSDNIRNPKDGNFTLLDYESTNKLYIQTVYFYKLVDDQYITLYSNTYTIRNIKKSNNDLYNKELLKLLKLACNGTQICDLIKSYNSWHNKSNEETTHDILYYKDNFGLFAKDKNLITNDKQVALLNYATHYSLVNSIIKLGIIDLKETREEFQILLANASKGAIQFLPNL